MSPPPPSPDFVPFEPVTLLGIGLGALLWYFIGLYAYTRDIAEALCERDDFLRLRYLEQALENRLLTILLAGPLCVLFDLITLDLECLHPERHVRREKAHAEWRREVDYVLPGETSPLLAHGPRFSTDERRRARQEAQSRLEERTADVLSQRRARRRYGQPTRE